MKRVLTLGCLALLIAVVILRIAVFGLSTIPQNGMYPLYPAGSHVVTLRRPYRSPGDVKRGDVIAFVQVIDGVQYKFIWRVVGLPNEVLETRAGRIVVNGQAAEYVNEPHKTIAQERINGVGYRVAFLPATTLVRDVVVKVPADALFVMGDNRNNAADSRVYGVVPFRNIVGKALFSW